MFTHNEKLCQSFWQSIKKQNFKAKKSRGGQFDPGLISEKVSFGKAKEHSHTYKQDFLVINHASPVYYGIDPDTCEAGGGALWELNEITLDWPPPPPPPKASSVKEQAIKFISTRGTE